MTPDVNIPNKTRMYGLLRTGALGNALRTWDSAAAVLRDDYEGNVGIRAARRSNPICLYDLPQSELLATMRREGVADRRDLVFCEAPPDAKRTIQGELTTLPDGRLYWNYSLAKSPMRPALLHDGHDAVGVKARAMLRHYADPASVDDIDTLLDRHPGAVIEFTCYRVPIGIWPHRRVIIWEVRNY